MESTDLLSKAFNSTILQFTLVFNDLYVNFEFFYFVFITFVLLKEQKGLIPEEFKLILNLNHSGWKFDFFYNFIVIVCNILYFICNFLKSELKDFEKLLFVYLQLILKYIFEMV